MEKPLNTAKAIVPDADEEYFNLHRDTEEWIRQARPGEWPEDNELLTSPPFTLVIRIHSRLFLKLGAWRSNANVRNTYVQLSKGRVPVSSYLEFLSRPAV